MDEVCVQHVWTTRRRVLKCYRRRNWIGCRFSCGGRSIKTQRVETAAMWRHRLPCHVTTNWRHHRRHQNCMMTTTKLMLTKLCQMRSSTTYFSGHQPTDCPANMSMGFQHTMMTRRHMHCPPTEWDSKMDSLRRQWCDILGFICLTAEFLMSLQLASSYISCWWYTTTCNYAVPVPILIQEAW